MMDKKKINEVLQGVIADKIQKLTHSIKLIDDSAANETKSSAGDKYETSRAMLQQEKDKKLGQLDLWNSYHASLKLIEVSQHDYIQLGSVVITDKNIIDTNAQNSLLLEVLHYCYASRINTFRVAVALRSW